MLDDCERACMGWQLGSPVPLSDPAGLDKQRAMFCSGWRPLPFATLTGLIVGWLRWRPGLFARHLFRGAGASLQQAWFTWHFWPG